MYRQQSTHIMNTHARIPPYFTSEDYVESAMSTMSHPNIASFIACKRPFSCLSHIVFISIRLLSMLSISIDHIPVQDWPNNGKKWKWTPNRSTTILSRHHRHHRCGQRSTSICQCIWDKGNTIYTQRDQTLRGPRQKKQKIEEKQLQLATSLN